MGSPALVKRIGVEARRALRGEAGSGLVLALFVVVLLTGVGVVLLAVTQTEMKMNQVDQRTKKAFYLAEAGTQHGREVLRRKMIAAGSFSLSSELREAAGGSASDVIDVQPANIRPIYNSAGVFTGLQGVGNDKPLVDKTVLGDGFYYAFLTNDPPDGRSSTADPPNGQPGHGRVIIVGVGVGSNRSFEVAETIVHIADVITTFPATITMLGADPTFHPGSSAPKMLSGLDCSGDPNIWVPVVGVEAGAVNNTRSDVDVKKDKPNQTMVDGDGTGLATIRDIQGELDERGWNDCQDFIGLAAYVKASADYVAGGPVTSTENLGTPGAPKTVFIDGDLTISGNFTGAGLLWVTGKLIIKGTVTWNGPIFVVGQGVYTNDGGGTANTLGASVVANVAGPDGKLGTTDDCTGGADGFGQPVFEFGGGGKHTTRYCERELNNALLRLPMRPTAFRQH